MKSNEPAFPVTIDRGFIDEPLKAYGLTIRAYFAGQALAGLSEEAVRAFTSTDRSGNWILKAVDKADHEDSMSAVACWCCELADALIAELAKGDK